MRITDTTRTPNFKGLLDEPLTKSLNLLNTNPMLNASMIDIFAMGLPRTAVEYKERNKYAGAEMAFREFTGTFIACFSAGLFGQMINKAASKYVNPEIKVNENSWASNNIIDVMNDIWQNSDKNTKSYTEKFFNSISGFIESDKTIEKEEVKQTFEKLISDKDLSPKDSKKMLKGLSEKVINITGVESSLNVTSGNHSAVSSVHNILRDSADLGKNVFSGNDVEVTIYKLKKLNKIKTFGAISLSVLLALTNQAVNRYITQKRTGSKEFVGNMDYGSSPDGKVDNKKNLTFNKLLASAGFAAMLAKVMNVKNFKDFAKRLEFTGPTTSGNAIKTVYGALILGRFIASKDNTELRETVVRDYLGFLNWLVLGGFVAKGVGQILDGKNKELLNVSKEGKGVKHWLQDISLKTHSEVMAQGGKNLKSNIKKLNIAHISGLLYSGIMLGILLPMLNIYMTKHKQTKQ